MVQVPIQSGVRVADGSYRTSYPVNLRHKAVQSGVSNGELVTTQGAVLKGTGPGADRGGINWNDTHYRVMGGKLCSIGASGAVTQLGTVADDGLLCRFDYGFDRLAINAMQNLYYWNGSALSQVTDPNLGPVLDVVWLAGYFITTDGTSVVVTNLNDPTTINPTNYGSAEDNPDAVTGLGTVAEELLIFGRYSIQFQRNVGGSGYPFQNIVGATIPKGCVGPNAKCRVGSTYAFVGGAEGEPIGVYMIAGGTAARISDEEIDAHIARCGTPETLAMECRQFGNEVEIIVHMDDCSVSLCAKASEVANAGLWHVLQGHDGTGYRTRNAVYVNGEHWVADGTNVGVLDETVSAQFGAEPGWSFDAGLLYNDGTGLILSEVELAGQFPPAGTSVFFSMTHDGATWSREIGRNLTGRRDERVMWRPGVLVNQLCGLHWRGFGKVAISRANANGEALAA